jgi:FkbM family methyltransferase
MIGKLMATLRWAARHPLNRDSGMKAMFAFARAQIGARLVSGDVCVPLPNETRLLVPPRMKGAVHFIWPGLYDFEEMSFVLHYLRPEDLFVDVGANIGIFTVLASGVAGARTLAFEPAPFAFDFLLKNVRLNNLTSLVNAQNAALGGQKGKIRITSGLGTENYVLLDKNPSESVEVELLTLDSLEANFHTVVAKIDVEGFEQEVLAGAKSFLARPSLQAMIIERVGNANRFGQNEDALHVYIRSLSLVPCAYEPRTRTLHRLADDARGNIIYVRNLEKANERLRQAPAYRFAGQEI